MRNIFLMKGEVLLIPDQIIEATEVAFKKRNRGFSCTITALSYDLVDFVKSQKDLIGEILWGNFKEGKGLSARTITRALNKDNEEHQCGAVEKLRNLLCYYSYSKSWLDTLKTIGITEEEVRKKSNGIKFSTKGLEHFNLKDEKNIATELSALKEMFIQMSLSHEKVLRTINDTKNEDGNNKFDLELDKKIENEIENRNFSKVATYYKIKLEDQMEALQKAKEKTIKHAFSLSHLMKTLGKFNAGIEYTNIIINSKPTESFDLSNAYFLKAYFLLKLNKKEEALSFVKESIKTYPNSALRGFNFMGVIYFSFDEFFMAEKTFNHAISLTLKNPLSFIASYTNLKKDQELPKKIEYDPILTTLYCNKCFIAREMNLIDVFEKLKFDILLLNNSPTYKENVEKYLDISNLGLNNKSEIKAHYKRLMQNDLHYPYYLEDYSFSRL